MSSYHIKNGEKKIFQFFENRYWDDDQDYLANDYFIFKVKENDLFALGYIYWAHIAIWLSGSANMVTKAEFIIDSFQEAICKELRDRKIENDPPNFGYNHTNLDVLAISWDYPKLKILEKSKYGLHCIDEDFDEFYFDLKEADLFSSEDLEYEDENPIVGSYLTIESCDPVFMSEFDFTFLKNEFLEKIGILNYIYSNAKFPHQIIISSE